MNVAQAAARIRRSPRTIERWIEDGDLPTTTILAIDGRVLRHVIDEETLLATFREKLQRPRGGKGKPRRRLAK